jgi:hypothetical protein
MKPDVRISVKDFHHDKNLKILLFRADFTRRQFHVRMNGAPWPADGRPVPITRLLNAIRKALVKAAGSTPTSLPSDQTSGLHNPLK